MPEGKSISFMAGEYPELDGLESGSKIKIQGQATVQMGSDGSGSIVFDSMEIETEGPATRELKRMTKSEDVYASGSESDGDDF